MKRLRHIARYLFSRRYRTYCKAHAITEALYGRKEEKGL